MREATIDEPNMDSADGEVFARHVGEALTKAIIDFIDYDPCKLAAQDVEVDRMEFDSSRGHYDVCLTGGLHVRSYRFRQLPIPPFSKDDPCLEVQYIGESWG